MDLALYLLAFVAGTAITALPANGDVNTDVFNFAMNLECLEVKPLVIPCML